MNKGDNMADLNQPKPAKVAFEIWYAMREKAIPQQHYKEIIKADFKGRGLKDYETLESFDKALVKYGVKL
jgi:hypothetical protein